jgi:hypothetical protein
VCLGPPCLFNLSAARRVDSLVTSVIIGDDFAARLSFGSCYDLRDACLSLHSTRHPTSPSSSTATATGATERDDTLVGLILSRSGYDQSPSSTLYRYPPLADPPSPVVAAPVELFEFSQFTALELLPQPEPELEQVVEGETLQALGYLMERLQASAMTAEKLFPPGRILHIVDREVWDTGRGRGDLGSLSEVREGEGRERLVLSEDESSVAYLCDQELFSSLQLSGKMFSAHLPTEYLTRLRRLFPLTT